MTTSGTETPAKAGGALVWAGLAALLLGIVLAGVSIFRTVGSIGLGDTVGSPVLEAPVTVVEYYEPETYFVYQAVDGAAEIVPDQVRVRGADGEVPVTVPGYQATIDDGQVSMEAVAAFTVTQAGEFAVTVTPDEPTLVRIAPALAAGVGSALAWGAGIATGVVLSLAGLGLLVVGLVRRSAGGTPSASVPLSGAAPLSPPPATAQVAAPGPSTPPPGWYPDPADARTQRYWDGQAWTEHHT